MPDISSFCPACGSSVAPERLSTTDSRERALGAVAYLGLLPALILFAIPDLRRNPFIRFHSWQAVLFSGSSILLGLVLKLLFVVFSFLPVVGFLLAWLSFGIAALGIVMLWVVLVVKAAQGERYQLPLIGPLAMQLAS